MYPMQRNGNNTSYFLAALFCGFAFPTHAELYEAEVRGTGDKGKADRAGFSVVMVDTSSDELLVHGVAAIPDDFGKIETAGLIVNDAQGKRLCTAILGSQRLEGAFSNFEFHLRRDLIAKSMIVISSRHGDDLHVVKIALGSFPIRDKKRNKTAAIERGTPDERAER